jgi:hypothetical protein
VLVTAADLLAYVTRQRNDPSACPYGLRFSLDLPHPYVTRSRLREILAPEPAQRVLEVGPGNGYYSLHAARWLEPDGTLEVLAHQGPKVGLYGFTLLSSRSTRRRRPRGSLLQRQSARCSSSRHATTPGPP